MNFVHYRTKGIPGHRPPGSFTTDSIRELLRDPFPTGLVAEYPTAPLDMSDDEESNPKAADSPPKVIGQRIPKRLVPGQHVAIISSALWQSNQQIRQQRGHNPSSTNHARRQYMLTGVGRCWDCWSERGADSPLYGTTGSGNSTRMYLCSWMKSRYKSKSDSADTSTDLSVDANLLLARPVAQPACRHAATRRAAPLEEATTRLVSHLRVPNDWYEAILAYVLCDDGLIDFERRTYNLRQELERTQRLYQLAQITEADYIQQAQVINARLQAVRPSARPEAQQAASHLQSFAMLWTQLTAGEQRGLLSIMFTGLYFDAKNHLRRVVTRAPFTQLLDVETVTELE